MDCNFLPYKESKLNFLDTLKKEGFIVGARNLDLAKKDEFNRYVEDMTMTLNRGYGLSLNSLYTLKTVESDRAPYKKIYNEKVVPNEDAFNQIDQARKALGIYESQESFGSYMQRQNRELERQQMEEDKWKKDDSIDNNIVKYFEGEKKQVEENRTRDLEALNEEFEKREDLTEEELNRIDVVNAKYDMQLEVLERTEQARLEDRQDNRKEKPDFQEEVIDENINNNPVLTAASIFTPNYDTYYQDKKNLLAKVEKALSKLYTISGKNKTSSTIANINKLNNLKTSFCNMVISLTRPKFYLVSYEL